MKTRNIARYFLIGALVTLGLLSCKKSSLSDAEKESRRKVVEFTVELSPYATKADDAYTGLVPFGIFAMDPIASINVQASQIGNTLVPNIDIKWAYNQKEASDFVAYCPYNEGFKNVDASFSVLKDQRSAESVERSDLQAGRATGTPGKPVAFVLKHCLSRLVASVTCEDATEKVTEVTFGDLVIEAKADLSTSLIVAGSAVGKIQTCPSSGGKDFVAIIVPQSVKLPIVVKTNKGRSLTFNDTAKTTYESGYSYVATITVPKEEAPQPSELTFKVSIADWADDGQLGFGDPEVTQI